MASSRVLIINGKAPNAGVGGVSAADFSHFSNRFLTPGVLGDTDYKVEAQTTPDMTVKYAAGEAYVPNPAGTMLFPVEDDTGGNVTIASNVSGNNRIDAIVIKIDTSATPNEYADNIITVQTVQGTPAASPSPLTDSEIQTALGAGFAWLRLANVTVENATVSITNADVSDARSQVAFTAGSDGWSVAGETWTYASAATFTVPGDQRAKYQKGTRIKLTQGALVKYFVVINSTFGANTTVTITGGTDYTLANSAISENFYSYQASPQGYPAAFTFTPTYTGFSVNPTGGVMRFSVHGRKVHIFRRGGTFGTSNATGFTIGVPITAATTPDFQVGGMAFVIDNGGAQASPARMYIQAGTSTITLEKTYASGAWTASGSKDAEFNNFTYEI